MPPLTFSKKYRPCVGILLVNANNQAFVGKRIDSQQSGKWQLPQGGIDPEEVPLNAARRELYEETGIDKARLISEYPGWLHYDLPEELQARLWNGRFQGQKQKWFCLRFTGKDQDIRLDHFQHPEFSEWKWAELEELPEGIVVFKKKLYQELSSYFKSVLEC